MTFKQAPPSDRDGDVSIQRHRDGTLSLRATTDGQEQWIRCTEFNAARLFGAMALFLGIPLSKVVGEAIKMTAPARTEQARPRFAAALRSAREGATARGTDKMTDEDIQAEVQAARRGRTRPPVTTPAVTATPVDDGEPQKKRAKRVRRRK